MSLKHSRTPCNAWRVRLTAPSWRAHACLSGMVLVLAAVVGAQDDSPQTPADTSAVYGAPTTRLGRYRLGPLYWTPSFRIGSIGLDTNVFYTPTDRQTDVTASGGPGLDVVLPVHGSLQIEASGALNYLYFLRTESQRRLGGNVMGRVLWGRERTRFSVQETLQRATSRPSFEVDRRIGLVTESTALELSRRLFGRVSLHIGGGRMRSQVDPGEVFMDSDLRRSMSRDSFWGNAGLEYTLTVKTSIIVESRRRSERFLLDRTRDADWDQLMGGLRTDATALVSGHALVGRGWVRPREGDPPAPFTLASVDATLNLSTKTHIGATYERNRTYSALAYGAGLPTLRNETAGANLDKDLWGRLNLRLFSRRTWFKSEGSSAVAQPGEAGQARGRDDQVDEAGADLGYRFRTHLRVGVMVSYVERRSNVADFGIDGLLVGLTVAYTP